MSSLWKRANGPQYRMLKIVAGAVLNAAHFHPGKPVDKKFARSVAKRAVGTISSQWAGLLAAPNKASSGAARGTPDHTARRRRAYLMALCKRGPARGYDRWPPLAIAVKNISRKIRPAREAGDHARADAYVECLKIIAKAAKQEVEQ